MASNGRLPPSALAPIAGSSPRPGGDPLLRRDAARAYNAMDAESRRRFGISLAIHEGTVRRAYRELAAQYEAKRIYGSNAATPGTSNHGLGLAVDLLTRQQRWAIDRIGAKYGWAKRWSDASWEWWHLKWRPGVWKPPARDPLWFLTADERRWVREYRRLKAANRNPARRGVLWRTLIQRRRDIYRAAQKSGWGKHHRRARYRYLHRLTKGS